MKNVFVFLIISLITIRLTKLKNDECLITRCNAIVLIVQPTAQMSVRSCRIDPGKKVSDEGLHFCAQTYLLHPFTVLVVGTYQPTDRH
jgi:hypothetical protein